MGAFTKDEAHVRTKKTWLLVASIAPLVALVGFAPVHHVAAYDAPAFTAVLLGVLVAGCGAILGLMHAWNRWWRERRGRLRADEQGLWLDDALVVARSAVRHGYVLRREGSTYVRLGRMLRQVDVAVADDEEGNALLTAMRLDPARSVGEYPMNHGTYRTALVRGGLVGLALGGALIACLLLVGTTAGVSLPVFICAAVCVAWSLNTVVRVSVGADGVRVRRLLSRSRFIPFGALESAETDDRNVALRLRDGTVIEMHHPAGKGWKPLLFHDRAEEGRMLVDRINTQAEHHKRARGEVHVLARAGRGTQEWLREVTLASDAHASFRAPAVPAEALWRVVEDPSAASTARAGAALALRARLDDEGRTRLRVLADACAAPRLRVALQVAASTAETDALEEAFEFLQDDELRAGQRRA